MVVGVCAGGTAAGVYAGGTVVGVCICGTVAGVMHGLVSTRYRFLKLASLISIVLYSHTVYLLKV